MSMNKITESSSENDLAKEVKYIVGNERIRLQQKILEGKKNNLKHGDFQKCCIKRLKDSGIEVKVCKPYIDKESNPNKEKYVVPIKCKKKCEKGEMKYNVEISDDFNDDKTIKQRGNILSRTLEKIGIVAVAMIIGSELFGDKIGNIVDFDSLGIETDDNTFSFNNNEEKEFIYDMIYRLEEKQPVDENGNPTVDIIEVKNDYAHYEVWNPGHLTGKELKQGDVRDMTQEQIETLHSTAAEMKRAENIGRDFPNKVSTTGMFDVGRDSNGEEDENKLPRYVAFESLFEMVKHNGTEVVAYGGGKECVEKTSDEILNMLIDFTAMTNALTNTTKSVCHGDLYDLPSRIKDGTVVRYADEHGDPLNLMADEELKQRVINEISKRTEYYKSIGVNYDDYINYARSRKTKETQSKLSSDDEAAFSNLSEQEKQNIAEAYQYFKDECDMDIDEIGVSGIVGVILATSKGNTTYAGNDGTYGILPVNKANLQNWAEQNGKNIEDIETQLEYYSEVVLKNTSYYLGVDQNDFNEYSYPVKYGNLKFICAGDAANWTLLYALHLDSSDYAKKMAELIYEHRKELEETRVTFLTTDDYEIGYDESYITDWRENLKVDVDEKKAIEAFEEKKEKNFINEYEIVS